MGMMHVRNVSVDMLEAVMPMTMGVWLSRRIICCMSVLMMIVVAVSVGMFRRLMFVLMLMVFREMEPSPNRH